MCTICGRDLRKYFGNATNGQGIGHTTHHAERANGHAQRLNFSRSRTSIGQRNDVVLILLAIYRGEQVIEDIFRPVRSESSNDMCDFHAGIDSLRIGTWDALGRSVGSTRQSFADHIRNRAHGKGTHAVTFAGKSEFLKNPFQNLQVLLQMNAEIVRMKPDVEDGVFECRQLT